MDYDKKMVWFNEALSACNCFIDEFTGKAPGASLHNVSIPDEICRQYESIEQKSFIFSNKH